MNFNVSLRYNELDHVMLLRLMHQKRRRLIIAHATVMNVGLSLSLLVIYDFEIMAKSDWFYCATRKAIWSRKLRIPS